MNKRTVSIGFWSSLSMAALFIIFIGCFVAIVITAPLFRWTNLQGYVAYVNAYDQSFKYIAQTAMLLFGPLFVIVASCIHDIADDSKKIFTRISIAFAVAFAVLIGIHYFVQISAVRLNINKGSIEGIEQFLQGKPDSAIMAVNMLGWTLFFGLSSLFLAPAFSGGRLERSIRNFFLLNGLFCILAGVGYVFENVPLVFLTINLGMGGCVTTVSVLLGLYFKRAQSVRD